MKEAEGSQRRSRGQAIPNP